MHLSSSFVKASLSAMLVSAMFQPVVTYAAVSLEESIQQVYLAFYGRPGDPDGVTYWTGQAGAGGVPMILNQFSSSLEANQLFAGMSDEGKIAFIYRVLFSRNPDSAGLAYWAGELSSGKRSLQEVSFEILQGALNDDLTMIANKVKAATFFSNELIARNIKADYSSQADIFLARNWIAKIDATQASLDAAKADIIAVLNRISTAGKTGTVSGFLATPSTTSQVAASAAYFLPVPVKSAMYAGDKMTAAVSAAVSPMCFGVPDGYSPLSGAVVTQIDAFGSLTALESADECGFFVLTTSPMAVQMEVSASGYRTVRTSLATFMDPDKNSLPDPLTLIPTTSSYQLSGLRLINGNQLYFNLIDSATTKSVLGLTASNVSITNNTSPVSISQFGYGASISNTPASVAIVLDASGSMDTYYAPTRYQLAAASARLFVSRKASADQVSLTFFDDQVLYLNQTNTAQMVADHGLSFTDGSGNPLAITAPVDGYTANTLFAEQMLKFYDPKSDAWLKTDPFFRVASGSYPLNGATAVYTAALTGVNSLQNSANRRYALVLTDGGDNSSYPNTVDTVITAAKANNVATYTIGIGSSVNNTALARLANETGGTFAQVTDLTQVNSLSTVFDAIRTKIAFDYVAFLTSNPATGNVAVSIDIGGMIVEGTVTVGP